MMTLDWWVGVVIVGLVINVLAAYLKPRCDALFATLSRSWSTRTADRRRARDTRIERMKGNKEEQMVVLIESLHKRVRGIGGILFGMIITVIALSFPPHKTLFGILSARIMILFLAQVPIMMGFSDWFDVIRIRGEIHEAQKEDLTSPAI